MNLKEKVLTVITEHTMLSDNATVVVGLSGGADSVTLLHVLCSLRNDLLISDIVAVHIDHRLRGEESQRDYRFCEELCEKWGVPYYGFSYDVKKLAQQAGKGIEEMGRELRYQAFNEVASRFPCARIATAHNTNDNVETVLFHLCRGSGVRGLTGIPAVRDILIRPLITCTRYEIEQYCRDHELSYVTDNTNTDLSYTRNRIRHEVIPVLRQINPTVESSVIRLAEQMKKAEKFLQKHAEPYWLAMQTGNEGVYHHIPLKEADEAIRPLLFIKILEQLHIPYDEKHIQSLCDCLHSGDTLSLPKNHKFTIHNEYVYVWKNDENETQAECSLSLKDKSTVVFGGKTYRISVLGREEYEQKLNIYKLVFKNAFDYDMISGDLFLRKRREGDRYHPVGRGCGKSLKKLFNEAAIFTPYRNNIPVLCDEHGIVLVYDFGCDERVRITESTRRILLIEKAEE